MIQTKRLKEWGVGTLASCEVIGWKKVRDYKTLPLRPCGADVLIRETSWRPALPYDPLPPPTTHLVMKKSLIKKEIYSLLTDRGGWRDEEVVEKELYVDQWCLAVQMLFLTQHIHLEWVSGGCGLVCISCPRARIAENSRVSALNDCWETPLPSFKVGWGPIHNQMFLRIHTHIEQRESRQRESCESWSVSESSNIRNTETPKMERLWTLFSPDVIPQGIVKKCNTHPISVSLMLRDHYSYQPGDTQQQSCLRHRECLCSQTHSSCHLQHVQTGVSWEENCSNRISQPWPKHLTHYMVHTGSEQHMIVYLLIKCIQYKPTHKRAESVTSVLS